MRGRPRTPTKVLEMRGAFDKHPERARAAEPQVKQPLGDPPAEMSAAEVAVWREIQGIGHWLTAADRLQAEIASTAMVQFRVTKDTKYGTLAQSALAKLGFNPVDRTRITAGGNTDRSRDPAEAYFG